MIKTFLISDTFFGRNEIIKQLNRPFDDIIDMENQMISRWNETVGKNDIVYHLGNFAWDTITAERVIQQLNGRIKLIIGEYDDAIVEIASYHNNIEILTVQYYKDSRNKAVFSHWPLLEWPGKDMDLYHFHGHSLTNLKTNLKESNRINMVCDKWNYKPQNIEILYELFNEFKSL